MTTTATVGYVAIERLSIVAVPLRLFLMGGLIGKIMGSEGKSEWLFALPKGDITLTMGSAISMVMASWMMIVVACPDLARWAKSKKDAFYAGFFGFLLGNSVMICLAILLVRMTGIEDVILIMLSVGWGVFALLILVLAQWTINDNLLYSAGLGLSSLIRHTPKYMLTMISGLIGSAIAFFQIHEYFNVFLTVIGALLSPVAAIYLVEFLFLNRTRFLFSFIQDKKIPSFYWTAMISWVLVFITTPTNDGGLGWFSITGASSLDGFLFAGLFHLLIGKITQKMNVHKGEVADV
ncbi:permease for cytosine/purines [Desmospora activa DSM 45169]|uniref:Permease for cytosine/purines n=2 Tax=Desmospora TaxID=500614 RepID=A0A2T4Z0N1_9BACL|nr:permease for cytosine/purines [Desmospora activa DSM 45169]